MTLQIGAKIKALRKRDDITQEQFAEKLGVTGQAISKWESGAGCPDIGMILPIANFFNVTIDYLFDRDVSEKQKKIEELCNEYNSHKRNTDLPQERVTMMRRALAEFPGEEKLLCRLGESLFENWQEQGIAREWVDGADYWDYKQFKSHEGWEEATEIMEGLLGSSTDDTIRQWARVTLAVIYAQTGQTEKAMDMARKRDPLSVCREVLLAQTIDGNDGRRYKQEALLASIGLVANYLPNCACETGDTETIIKAYEMVLELYKFIFSDGNYGTHTLWWQYRHYAVSLTAFKMYDKAIEAIENAFEHAKLFDRTIAQIKASTEKGQPYKYTAPMINMAEATPDEIIAVPPMAQVILDDLTSETSYVYQQLHTYPRYAALVEMVRKST